MTTTTATTSTTTAPLSTSPMSLKSNSKLDSTFIPSKESIDFPDAAVPAFTPGQCLFCPNHSPSFPDSVIHMQKSHGLFVPYQKHLLVDLETIFNYLHLVIFGYRECLLCGTERTTVQAVQQHMTSKGHCRFDISEPGSEFVEFYDFSEPEDESESDIEGDGDETVQEDMATSLKRKSLRFDEDSIRLPSGKIISRQSSAPAGPSLSQLRHRTRKPASRLEYTAETLSDRQMLSNNECDFGLHDTRLSKKEKRERAMVTYQLANMSQNDRNSLMHLPASQQRAILLTQHRLTEKVQKEERRHQGKVDRKGNKNLYAYWHTETPVYQCG